MTQPRAILSFVVLGTALLLLPAKAAAQQGGGGNAVTPTLAPTPLGQLITVNNGPGDHFDPHVSADLVAYSNMDASGCQTIHYFNLVTLSDAAVLFNCTVSSDFLSDVGGTVIAFTHVDSSHSAISTFDTANPANAPVELAPQAGSFRQDAQIGDQTVAWQDYGYYNNGLASDIVAYDRASGTVTRLTSDGHTNQNPGISPDGMVITWADCSSFSACDIWSATGGGGKWAPHLLTNGTTGGGLCSHPDTDGQIVAYSCNRSGKDNIYWQPVGGGTEQALNFAGSSITPAASGGLISFANRSPVATNHNIWVFDTFTANLFQLTTGTQDNVLSDISVTPDGKVRVVWQSAASTVIAYTFTLPVGDFSFAPIQAMSITAGSSGSTNVTVDPLNGFSSTVNLSVSAQPPGVTASLSANSVTPSGGNPATAVLNVSVPDFITPTSFTLTVTGTSGSLSHSATANVAVTATTTSIGNLIGDLVGQGCVDAGVGNALLSKLSAAQSAGNVQTEINTLTALKNQINAQAGKHIATSCTLAGVTINPVTALLLDVQGLIDSLRVGLTPDPITGNVVDANGVGVPGVGVSIVDGNGLTVATAITDITGFYFIATTGNVLALNANYTLVVTGVPVPFMNATPASQPFLWQGTAVTLANFVLN